MQTRRTVYFNAPRQVEVRQEPIPQPGLGQVLVQTLFSAISPGTEMLVYRGQFPDLPVDASIESLEGGFAYPLAYGYACVGRVIQTGPGVGAEWQDRMVFSFQPHTSFFTCEPHALMPLPAGLSPETACFLPNMETAVNLVQDGAPLLGENVLVFGQGIVGLLTTALLAQFPLGSLVCVDLLANRRAAALASGATAAFDPCEQYFKQQAQQLLGSGADLVFELSGAPQALDQAIALTRFSGRVLIGSWYGTKRAPLDLGGSFHRSRIRLISSQVSSIAPELSGRWDKTRRFNLAWQALERIQPEKWISARFPIAQAAAAYELLDQRPGEVMQIVFEY